MQENIKFTNRLGHSLAGILHRPNDGEPIGCALFAHCFTCTKNIKAAGQIAETLSQKGFLVLRFDFTGLGASTGEFVNSNFSTNVDDLVDAAAYLSENHIAPSLLVGHSLGGTAILASAKHIESARAVASIGSPASPEHILHLLECKIDQIAEDGEAQVDLGHNEFTFNQEFVDDVKTYDIDYKNLNKALMVMHSPIDTTVSINQAAKIFGSAMHPKSFVSLDKADHLLTNKDDASYAADVLARWAKHYTEN